MFILNPQSGVPIYRQILEQVRRMVASGQLAPGTALPSVRDLAIRHTINPMTISRAYSLLEAEGLLERNRGRPMTVANQSRNHSQLPKRLQQVDPLVKQTVMAAKQLQLTEAELVKAIRREWEQNDE
ncbi:MAG TPA: GntR family transcriptional regulator [Steroidobacteraceae bacterium]